MGAFPAPSGGGLPTGWTQVSPTVVNANGTQIVGLDVLRVTGTIQSDSGGIESNGLSAGAFGQLGAGVADHGVQGFGGTATSATSAIIGYDVNGNPLFQVRCDNRTGFFGSTPAARQTLTSATATPEQIALALEASTLMDGT